jgi:sugar phosphate isomerase/epimerase
MAYNRKEFLKTSAAATAGLLLGDSLFASSLTEEAKVKRYGMQLYTVRNDVAKNLTSTLQYIAKAGYSQLEMFGFDGAKFFGKTPKEMKALLTANKLTSPSGHYYSPPFLYEGKDDAWKAIVEAAAIMGHQYITIPWLDDKHRGGEDFKKLVDTLHKAAEMTKAAGMKLAYHNHEFEFEKMEDGTTYYEYMLSKTDPALIDFEMDLYWVVYAGHKPTDWFKKHPGRFSLWHIKDMTINKEGKKESTQVGDGTIDFASVFAQRKLCGLKYGFMEQEAYTMPEEQCIKKSIAYLKKKNWGN